MSLMFLFLKTLILKNSNTVLLSNLFRRNVSDPLKKKKNKAKETKSDLIHLKG